MNHSNFLVMEFIFRLPFHMMHNTKVFEYTRSKPKGVSLVSLTFA